MGVFFYFGDEEFLIEQAINDKKKSLDENFASINFKTYNNPNFIDLIGILRTQPMMFGNMLIVINCVDYFTKTFDDKELKEIELALESNNPNTDIVFCAIYPRNEGKKPDARKKIFKILSKYNKQEFTSIPTYKIAELGNYIQKFAKQNKVTIEKDAVETLIAQIGNNLRELNSEIEKLALCAYPEKKIDKDMVKNVGISNEELFNFTEFIMIGQKAKALNELNKLLEKRHGLEILAALQTMLRRWIFTKLYEKSKSASEIAKLTGQNEYVVKLNLQKMKQQSLKELVKLKENLTEVEYSIKSGNSIDIEGELKNAILR